jgi:hypothetical protein
MGGHEGQEDGVRRPPGLQRLLQVLLRTLHIAAMGIVLGGCFLGAGYEALRIAIWVTLGSGTALLLMDLFKGPEVLLQGSGMAVLLKLSLLGFGQLLSDHRFAWYLAATLVASFGSHMPRAWRHHVLLPPPGPHS